VVKGPSSANGQKQVRSWWDVGSLLRERNPSTIREGVTFYAMNARSVFNEDLDDIEEATVVVRTHNNQMIVSEKFSGFTQQLEVASLLFDCGYQVIGIPKNAKYDNDSLCEIDQLTTEHLNRLRGQIKDMEDYIALNAVLVFSDKFNAFVGEIFDKNWVIDGSDRSKYMLNVAELRKQLGNKYSEIPNKHRRGVASYQRVLAFLGDDDFTLCYPDVDALCTKVNECSNFDFELPSKIVENLKLVFDHKAAILSFINGYSHLGISFRSEAVEKVFEEFTTNWIIKFVDELD
jgi:hypothetical protein